MQEVRTSLADQGMEIFPRDQQTPQALGDFQKAEIEKWWPIIKAANIKVECSFARDRISGTFGMQRSDLIALLAATLAAASVVDVVMVRGQIGSIAPQKRRAIFWHLCGGCAVLLPCAAMITWAVIFPVSF
jgi:hypothetical protein